MRAALLAPALAVALGACSAVPTSAPDPMPDARALTLDALVVDTHIDVPYRLRERFEDVSGATASGDFDYPRAIAGGLDVAFMSIYVPASYQESGGAFAYADSLIDMMETIAADAPDKFAVVRSVDDVARLRQPGRVLFALGMENGAPVESDLANLTHFRDRGVRYITLTHSRDNEISDSSYDDAGTHGGLSAFGREVVAEMNALGIMVDVSHVSDAAFEDVMEVTTAPVLATHSSARHFTPGFERNMSDAMIERLAENGGVIQINFGSTFLLKRVQDDRDALRARFAAELEASGIAPGTPEADAAQAAFDAENPLRLADLSDVADHIDHVVALVGIDHVGIGSDYDGVGPTLPVGLEDVSTYPALVAELLRRGYAEGDVRKVLGGNTMRVWAEVERLATK